MVNAGKTPFSNALNNSVPDKTLHKILEPGDNWKFISVSLLNAGNVSHMIMNEMNKAIRHVKNDSVKNWRNNCTRLPPIIFRMLISLVRALAFAMVRFT